MFNILKPQSTAKDESLSMLEQKNYDIRRAYREFNHIAGDIFCYWVAQTPQEKAKALSELYKFTRLIEKEVCTNGNDAMSITISALISQAKEQPPNE
jgi:hypothetical protein